MKLKDTKYLLPTTEGRLHKELSYLISLHENKMNKGKIKNRLDDLENKVNEMSHALSMMYNSIESSEQLFENDETCTANDDIIITSTTLKTPNEWLKLMSDEEVGNLIIQIRNFHDPNELITFKSFICQTVLKWRRTPQGYDYWNNISNRYNN